MLRLSFQILIFLSVCIPCLVFADSSGSALGDIAGNLMEPVNILSDTFANAAIIIGATFLFGGFIKYMQYRVNPLAVPISDVIFLFIFGVLLILLPLSYKLLYSTSPAAATEISTTHSQK